MYKALLLLVFYLPFQLALNPSEGIDLASVRVIIIILFLVWLAQGLARKKLWIPRDAQTMWLVSFLFLCAFSVVVAENKEWFGRKLLFLLSVIPLYFTVADITTDRIKAVKIVKILVISGLLAALVGIVQFFSQFVLELDKTYSLWAVIIKPFLGSSFSQAVLQNPSWLVNIGGNTYLRATSFFPDPHMFSFYLGMLIPLAGGLYFIKKQVASSACLIGRQATRRSGGKRETKSYSSLLWGTSFFVLLAADILTFSRGGYLGLAGGAIMALFLFRGQIKKALFALAVALIGIIVMGVLLPNPVSKRLYSIFDWQEGSNRGRIETWRKAWEVWEENPIMGVGLGNYPLATKATASYREPIYAHNTYLDIAVDTGIFSFVSWVAFLFSVFVAFYRRSKHDTLCLAGSISIVIFALHSLVETGIYSPVVLGVLMVLGGMSGIEYKNNP